MNAARENKQEVTPLYLNSGLGGNDATELAQQLYVVLNSRLPVRVNILSDRSEGSLVNPLKPDEDVVGTINTARGPLELVVERVDDGNGMRVWLFSRQTLQAIPDVYKEIDLVTVDGLLAGVHGAAARRRIRVLDWLVMIAGIPLLYRLLGLLGPLFHSTHSPCVCRLLGRPQGPKLVEIHGSNPAVAPGRDHPVVRPHHRPPSHRAAALRGPSAWPS
jgi:hypothetical protein